MRTSSDDIPAWRWLPWLGIAALGMAAIIVRVGLLADGSHFLLSILQRESLFSLWWARAAAVLINQFPVLVALAAGSRDLDALVLLHSLGLAGTPLILWLVALRIQMHSDLFVWLLLAFCACFLSSGFFVIGEYNVAYALTALLFAVIYRTEPLRSDLLVMPLLAVAAAASYESALFLAPLLLLPVVRELATRPHLETVERISLASTAIALIAGAGIAAASILSPRDAAVLAHAVDFKPLLRSAHFLYVSAVIAGFIILQWLHQPRWALLLFLTLAGLSAAYLALPQTWITASRHYGFRTVSGLWLFVILGAAMLSRRRRSAFSTVEHRRRATGYASLAVLLLFGTLMLPFAIKLQRYDQWLTAFQGACMKSSTWQPVDQVDTIQRHPGNNEFGWGWTNPSMCILMRGNAKAGLLNATTYDGWQPMDPRQLTSNPLAAYKRRPLLP